MAESTRRLKLPYFRLSLGFIGEDWQECWVEFAEMSWAQKKTLYAKASKLDTGDDASLEPAEREAKARRADEEAEAEIIAVVQQAFLKGKSLDADGNLIDLEAGDFNHQNFTPDTIMHFYNRIIGVPDPKASTTSPATTPEPGQNPSSTLSSDTESASVSQ